jgi:hypothetical protein
MSEQTQLQGEVNNAGDEPIIGQSVGYEPNQPGGYPATWGLEANKYLMQSPTLDLNKRTMTDMPGGTGSYGSEYSMDFIEGNTRTLIPTIVDGKRLTTSEALLHYQNTGEHMGKFKRNVPGAVFDEYANKVHSRKQYAKGQELSGDTWAQLKGRQPPAEETPPTFNE